MTQEYHYTEIYMSLFYVEVHISVSSLHEVTKVLWN